MGSWQHWEKHKLNSEVTVVRRILCTSYCAQWVIYIWCLIEFSQIYEFHMYFIQYQCSLWFNELCKTSSAVCACVLLKESMVCHYPVYQAYFSKAVNLFYFLKWNFLYNYVYHMTQRFCCLGIDPREMKTFFHMKTFI